MGYFSPKELAYFKAENGAKSNVTDREATGDKAVTIDRFEKEILFSRYPKESFTRAGGALPDDKPDTHIFNIYSIDSKSFEPHDVVVKHPKAKGNELRLYFNRPSAFYPDADKDWFIFTRAGEPHPFIGIYPTTRLENLATGEKQRLAFEHDYALDKEDNEYLMAVASPRAQQGTVTYEVTTQKRDATLAAQRVKEADYKCQIDSQHTSFTSASSGQQFMEVHHLVPISKTEDFEHSLDIEANLIVLCPNCHRAIHFMEEDSKRKLLDKLFEGRKLALKEAGIAISIESLYDYYGISKNNTSNKD